MPRNSREKSATGIYHIMIRGINRQAIFEDDEDRLKFLKVIKAFKDDQGFELYAYCLMNNHVHLLLKEELDSVATIMKRICGSYVYWYNRKYERCGHLFQDRYKSEVVESDRYFLTVLRYIHQNPLKAGLVKSIDDYKWSSYNDYIGNKSGIVDIEFVLDIFSINDEKTLELFKEFNLEENQDACLEIKEKQKISDNEIMIYMAQQGIDNINKFQQLEKSKKIALLSDLKSVDGISVRQLARITGVSKSFIDRL